MVRHYYDGKGIPRVQGGKDLRGSQSYPKEPLALAFLWIHVHDTPWCEVWLRACFLQNKVGPAQSSPCLRVSTSCASDQEHLGHAAPREPELGEWS